MDRQASEYTYTPPPQYSYAPQPQLFPPQPPPAQQPFNPHGPPPQQPYNPAFPPQFPPFPQQQFYPYNFTAPPHATSAPPPPPPSDPELQKRIDKLAEYTLKNGPGFESMIREKQSNNPDYSFLFGGDGYSYYRYKLSNPHFTPVQMPPVPYQQIPPPVPYQQLYLPAEVAVECEVALTGLTGTKESIKAAKSWFMNRAVFAPVLAEKLRERVFALEDSERQMHVIFLANDILFESLQRRTNPRDLDPEARSLLPVLGSMLGRVYANPSSQHENRSRLARIVQFWASKEVFDQETIGVLEREMVGASGSGTVATSAGFIQQPHNWPHETPQPNTLPPFPIPTPPMLTQQPSLPDPTPYPLFPPGLIPGMVRKTQVGSGVPYSPLNPSDIPSLIPPSQIPDSQIREKVSRFFQEIQEPLKDDEYEREEEGSMRGVCVPPPVGLGEKDGTGRLGLGAREERERGERERGEERESGYDDVYDSYRKQRSVGYHSFMSSRAESRV
ncbi:hypothetical protein LUZ60_007438 [Juncus effusus]|nr:hypothetical protein LUZ60_007438 [Juncus effusus]